MDTHGWNLAHPAGTLITSATAGRAHVTLGFGNNVQVQVGNLWIRYAHLQVVLVSDGDEVAPGAWSGWRG